MCRFIVLMKYNKSKLYYVLPVLYLGLVIFQMPFISDEVDISIFYQLIFSLTSGLFSLQSIILYVVLCCFVIEMVWSKIRKLEYFTYIAMYVLRFMCECIFWQIIHSYFYETINEPIFYFLFFMLICGVSQISCVFLKYFCSYGIFS